ncbi:hypothetical protein G6L37_03890 [Agrobacterium rubi]|nr:hypothetical protein [Agrobacterium rubi]NTF24491.1 hypothetical protein [Agrobacterium rubi]
MRKYDFGTCQAYVDDDVIDVFFAKPHDEVKNLLKTRWKARWEGERFCFRIRRKYVQDSETVIAEAIEAELYAAAPPKWKEMVERLGAMTCASKRYEIKIGAGGLRIMLPGGHSLHYHISKLLGEKQRSDTWELPAKAVKGSDMRFVLEKAVKEDLKVFTEEVEPYEGRTITGTALLEPRLADAFGIRKGEIVFANYSFLRTADPQVVNPDIVRRQVRAWPFIVNSRVDGPEPSYTDLPEGVGVTLQLAYPPAAVGYNAVRAYMAMAEKDRPPALDDPHAMYKWRFRNA